MSIDIMSKVWKSEGTSGTKRLVLLALADQANDQGVCWPSLATIARKAGCSRTFAKQLVHELRDEGYIGIEYRRKDDTENESNRYYINISALGVGNPASQGREVGLPGVGRWGYPKPSFNQEVVVVEESPKRPNIFGMYERVIGPLIPGLTDILIDAEKRYSQEWLEAAFEDTAKANGRSWNYTKAILESWERNGFRVDARKGVPRRKPVKEEHYFEVHR